MAYTTIDKPDDYFNTKLYTGDGNSTQAVTGVGFQPDWIWIKNRTDAHWHNLNDSVRGAGAGQVLRSNRTAPEGGTSGHVSSFDSDGFTVATGTSDAEEVNTSSDNYVSWNWLANGTGSSNTDGSITSTVSANTTAGFSIVSYTGTGSNATVGHGLGSTPAFMMVKNRDASQGWCIYHHKNTSAPETDFLSINSSDATVDAADRWNDTAPTSSVFSVANHADTNGSSATYIGYFFNEVKGYSKFGSYTGNGSTDGPFIYTGFKPAFFMAKRTDSTGNWHMHDNKRDVDNGVTFELRANTADAEVDVFSVAGEHRADFLSNGIKTRTTGAAVNASGGTYIYMAFAENPFVTSTGIPTTAR